MIMSDKVRDLILKMDVFCTKKGKDISVTKELVGLINDIFGDNALDSIFVNTDDQFNIPDVAVIPLYNQEFSSFIMTDDFANCCPYGYTIEIHQRVFEKLNPEELTALVLHDVLQNVESCTAKLRLLTAYNSVFSKYRNEDVLDLFDDISTSEVMFMMFVDICCRPFRVPASEAEYVATDATLKELGLADAYDSYLRKVLPMSNDTVETRMETETKNDYRTVRTIIKSCMDRDIRHYYAVFKNAIPLVSLENIFAGKTTVTSLGFISRKRSVRNRLVGKDGSMINEAAVLNETYINPRNEVEYRFQVDKIIADIRYCETEAERQVILIKIKNLALKFTKVKGLLEKDLEKDSSSETLNHQYTFIMNLLDELDMLRKKTLELDLTRKPYGLWVRGAGPDGYTG